MYEGLVEELRHYFESVPLVMEAASAIEEMSHVIDDLHDANVALYGALPRWIPLDEGLPVEKTSPMTHDWLEYPCICIDRKQRRLEVRYYKFGRGHFRNGGQIMDDSVLAWQERPSIHVGMPDDLLRRIDQ